MDNRTIRQMTKRDMKGSFGAILVSLILILVISNLVAGVLIALLPGGNINIIDNIMYDQPVVDGRVPNIFVAFNLSGPVLIKQGIGYFLSNLITLLFGLGFTFGLLGVTEQRPMKVESIFSAFNRESPKYVITYILWWIVLALPQLIGGLIIMLAFRTIGNSASILMFIVMLIVAIVSIDLSLALSQIPFILKDKPELGVVDTIKYSYVRMKGNKGQLITLGLSYIVIPVAAMLVLTIAIALLSDVISRTAVAAIGIFGVLAILVLGLYLAIHMNLAFAEFYRYVVSPPIITEGDY